VTGTLPSPAPLPFSPEPIPLNILFEDDQIIVLDKPAGLVVHPAPGHDTGTLVNALLHHCTDLSGIGGRRRPGIVHRLDKDTSGTLVVAKTAAAHAELSHQFKQRQVCKTYLALVIGNMTGSEGRIILPIGRHPQDRKRMATVSRRPREAETRWRVREHFNGCCLLELDLKTGRTHQIRVHCSAIHHPIIGDPAYGPKRRKYPTGAYGLSKAVAHILAGAQRQMLHAWRLACEHPISAEPLVFESAIPQDMQAVLDALRQAAVKNL
jgi:23S rRNA pseudouridine1911/1915/1917 synthase